MILADEGKLPIAFTKRTNPSNQDKKENENEKNWFFGITMTGDKNRRAKI